MSKSRHVAFSVRSLATRYSTGTRLHRHHHDWHQLLYASDGVMAVETDDGTWVVPPQRAVWVPAGVEHALTMHGAVFMRTLYLKPTASRRRDDRCHVLHVSPLLRELILHIVALGALESRHQGHRQLHGVLTELLTQGPLPPLRLPMPLDPRARAAAELLQEDPSRVWTAARARLTAASTRTLERLFHEETGLSFGRWRQQLRLLHALTLLAKGGKVGSVALDVGYQSPSAFISAFRRTFGVTPGQVF